MKSFNEFTITEAKLVALTPAQLGSTNSKTGEQRTDILIRLIQNGSAVELVSGKAITIENSPELIDNIKSWTADGSARKAAIPFLDVKGNPYTTSMES